MKTGRDAVRDGRHLMENDESPRADAFRWRRHEQAAEAVLNRFVRPALRGFWGDPSMFRGPGHPNYREQYQRVGDETA